SSNVHDIVEFGRAIKDAGADAVSAIDAVKAGIAVDPVTGRPALLQQGFGRISGESIKPLALCNVAQLAHYVGIPIIGMGGVTTGVDAIEMISCGATAVGMCTALIIGGPEKVAQVNEEIRKFMREHGFSSLDEIRGRTLSQIDFPETTEERQEYEKRPVQAMDWTAVIDQGRCVKCGVCRRVCLYGAVDERDGAFVIDPKRCKACGLCVSMCPVSAIEYKEKAR
ncbi:4Fe-4S binding protein, partial [bacterium]|nr:4Fe-4S binding protein [bacterium]